MSMKRTPQRCLLGNVRNLANSWKAGNSELCVRKLTFCVIWRRRGHVLVRTVLQARECHGWVSVTGAPSQNLNSVETEELPS